jgi:organic hydroperoxide reductase OsmC/OhrA
MQDFPHRYRASADATPDGDVCLTSRGLPSLQTASPAEFGGPGDRWSPETLLTGVVADCFILTFRAVARASRLPWSALHCEVTGTLDRVEKITRFSAFDLTARLDVPEGTDRVLAQNALETAEHNCLVSSSLKGAVHLHPELHFADQQVLAGERFQLVRSVGS